MPQPLNLKWEPERDMSKVPSLDVKGCERKMEKELRRSLTIERQQGAIEHDLETRTISLSFSSEAPYRRYDWWENEYYQEVLSHNPDAIDTSRMDIGAPLLYNHDWDQQIGVVQKIWLDEKEKKLRAEVKFSKSAFANDVYQDVIDGIRSQVSVGYRPLNAEKTGMVDGENIYTITHWQPYEITIATIAADPTVGVGRSMESLVREAEPDPTDPQENDEDETEDDDPDGNQETDIEEPSKEEKSLVTPPENERIDVMVDTVTVETIRAAEITRMNAIRSIGSNFPGLWSDDELNGALNSDIKAEEFSIKTLDKLSREGVGIRQAEDPIIGMSKKELDQFSFRRLMLGLMEGNDKIRTIAPFEYECSEAALQKMGGVAKTLEQKRAEGGSAVIRVPMDVLRAERTFRVPAQGDQRTMSVGTTTAGGYTVATDLLVSNFIEVLRNAMVLDKLGITILAGLTGNVAIPRQTGQAAYYWVSEGNTTTASNATFDQVPLTPKMLSAMTDFTRTLLLQSSLDVETFVQTELAIIMALGIQDGVINGTGSSNDPTGILNISGIGAVDGGTNGAAPTYENMVDLESAVANSNIVGTNFGYLTNTKVRGKLKKTVTLSNTIGEPVWKNNQVNDNPALVSNVVPSNLTKGSSSGVCSSIIYAAWNHIVLGLWGGLDIMYNPYVLSGTGKRRFEVYQALDVQARHPEAIAAMKDALTS